MEVIFLFGTTQAFFLAFLVFSKKNKFIGDYVLASWLIFLGLHLLNYYLRVTGFLLLHPHLLGIGVCFPMLHGPLMLVYVLVMINKSGRLKPVYWLHGLPFLLFNLYLIFDFYLLSATEKLSYYELQNVNPKPMVMLLELLNTFLGPAYVIWSLFELRKHMKNIAHSFSYTDQINLNWLKYVLGVWGFVWLTVIFANVIGNFPVFTEGLTNHVIYITVTVVVFFLGYFGIKQGAIYVNVPDTERKKEITISLSEKKEGERYQRSGLKKTEADEQLKKLLDYMENQKPYLNGKLSLKEVAEFLDVSVHHLSQVINEQLGKNFFDFVNSYRIEEVKRHFGDSRHEQYTLLAVAYDSGFNSKSSFNSIFKKLTGLTPSQYLQSK